MAKQRMTAGVRLVAMTVGLVCVCVLPASGQQTVGAGFLGGSLQCAPGSNPALFDVTGDGPTADDLPAFLEIVPTEGGANVLAARFPTEDCFDPETRQFFAYEGTSNNPFPPGTTNTLTGLVGGMFEGNSADNNGDFVGGTYFQGKNSYLIDLVPSPTGSGAYDRVAANGNGLELITGIQGWDLGSRGDGVPDYIGLPWAGLTTFETCPSTPDLDDTMMLWFPVVPYAAAGGPPGAVTIQFDLDCDGNADGGYPPAPPIIPESTVPVALQSFTIASVLPSSPKGYALAFLFCALPIGALRLARRWLMGIDV